MSPRKARRILRALVIDYVADVAKVAAQLRVHERRIHDIIHGRSNFDPWLIKKMTKEFGLNKDKVDQLISIIHPPERVPTEPLVERTYVLPTRKERRALQANA